MPICKPIDFRHRPEFNLAERGRLLGIDVGTRRIGIAVSDEAWRVAVALLVITRHDFASFALMAQAIIKLAEEKNAHGLVIGLPLNMDGSHGAACDRVRDFTHALLKVRDFPVLLQDERLSTKAVARFRGEGANKKTGDETIDAEAAAWILQTALDGMRR